MIAPVAGVDHIVTGAAEQRIERRAAVQGIVAAFTAKRIPSAVTRQNVIAVVTDDRFGKARPRSIDIGRTGKSKVFEVGAQGP